MSSWRHVASECVTVEKSKALEMATKHAALPHSPVERTLDKKRVQRLVKIIKDGLALPFQWATVEYERQSVRMNGQHSSAAIVELGPELPDKLSFHLDRYQADDREGMVQLFRQFDQRWSMRSSLDVAGAYQGLQADIAQCNRKLMKVAAEAVSWWGRSVEGNAELPKGDDTYELLHNRLYIPFYVWLNSINNGRRELMKKEVVAAMYASFDVSESGASKFWREVSYGPDYFSDDMEPGALLIGQLSQAMEDRDFKEKEFPQSATYYKKCVKAWNAFCAGQRISSLKVSKKAGWPEVARFGEEENSEAA